MAFKCGEERVLDEYAMVAEVLEEHIQVAEDVFLEATKNCEHDSTWICSPPIYRYYLNGEEIGKMMGYEAEGREPGRKNEYFLFLPPLEPKTVYWAREGLTREERDIYKERRDSGYYKAKMKE